MTRDYYELDRMNEQETCPRRRRRERLADRLRAKARAMQLRRDRKTKWLEFESEPKGRES